MTVVSKAVTVAATATLLETVENVGHESTMFGRDVGVSCLVRNPTGAGATVYVGGADVSTANGYPLAAGEAVSADLITETDLLYGRVASGTQTVNVLTTGA